MKKTCARCAVEFGTENKSRRFCGVACYRIVQRERPNKGTFRPGSAPWNQQLKGIHLSPGSEFKPGARPVNYVPVGTVRVRSHARDGERAWIKTAEPNEWRLRAVVEWERAHGHPLPAGLVVHHRDRDPLNDDHGNLQALTRAQHLDEHRADFARTRAPKVEQGDMFKAAKVRS